ncbi:hypothetical protein, partial [Rhizobium johnstonii]|uniref:hypothetical protein n=1 Tax=Rhizobium johnstonii TaxID=3019933 RepID=UPI003F9DD421
MATGAQGGLFGVLRETPVHVRQVEADGRKAVDASRRGADTGAAAGVSSAAPTTVHELLERIPTGVGDGPQVRVEHCPVGTRLLAREGVQVGAEVERLGRSREIPPDGSLDV